MQSVADVGANFRISGTGVVTETDKTAHIVKKLKLTGTPYKVPGCGVLWRAVVSMCRTNTPSPAPGAQEHGVYQGHVQQRARGRALRGRVAAHRLGHPRPGRSYVMLIFLHFFFFCIFVLFFHKSPAAEHPKRNCRSKRRTSSSRAPSARRSRTRS